MGHSRIYKTVVSILANNTLKRQELTAAAAERLYRGSELYDPLEIGSSSLLRGQIGAVIDEMTESGIIERAGEMLSLAPSRPVALRAEKCEREILLLLSHGPATKQRIRSTLEHTLGTDRTPTTKDDSILFSYIGQILKRLVNTGILKMESGVYSILPERAARAQDIGEMLELKNAFLTKLHSKGGEFFEHYFMTLLGKYMSKHGRTVTENRTTGGSADGGIDGIIRTEDSLGFREITMVQTKNRIDPSSETEVRGFYGAVCAAGGTRGIFATSSHLHPSALEFINAIDNCVSVDGSRIFEMAKECQYGLRARKGKYVIDNKLL